MVHINDKLNAGWNDFDVVTDYSHSTDELHGSNTTINTGAGITSWINVTTYMNGEYVTSSEFAVKDPTKTINFKPNDGLLIDNLEYASIEISFNSSLVNTRASPGKR